MPDSTSTSFDALKIGQQGWLAYLNAYVLRAEFLGFDSYEPDYPGERKRYYRALEPLRTDHEDIEAWHIVDDDSSLFEHREQAVEAVRKERLYWICRKEDELAKLKRGVE
jgi:hypothetical protein